MQTRVAVIGDYFYLTTGAAGLMFRSVDGTVWETLYPNSDSSKFIFTKFTNVVQSPNGRFAVYFGVNTHLSDKALVVDGTNASSVSATTKFIPLAITGNSATKYVVRAK